MSNSIHEAYKHVDEQLDVLCAAAESGERGRLILARKAVYDALRELIVADRAEWLRLSGQGG